MKRQPKQIAAYHHHSDLPKQEADTASGPYYVSAKDGPKFALVSGPYTNHREALDLLGRARAIAVELSPWAAFASFGTVRCKPDCALPGRLQEWGYDLALERRVD